jgi:DNA-binding NtrC family response regulator
LEIEKGINLEEAVANFEIHLIKRALEHTKGRQKRAARLLNVKYSTFCAKVKRYNIQAEERKESRDLSNEPRAQSVRTAAVSGV